MILCPEFIIFPKQMRKYVRYVSNNIQSCDSFPCCLLKLAIIATKTWLLPKTIINHHCWPEALLARDCTVHLKQENVGLVLSLVATLPAWCHVMRACEKRGNLIAGCRIEAPRLDRPREKSQGRWCRERRDLVRSCSDAPQLCRPESDLWESVTLTQIGVDVLHCSKIFFSSLCLSSSSSLPPITPL